jgi:hypothetical protein
MARKLFLGYLNTLAIILLVYFNGFLLLVTIFTIKVVQFIIILGVFAMVFIAKDIV